MTNHQTTALVSRQAGHMTPSVPAQAVPNTMSPTALPERIQLANALCKAGPMLPECYRDNPGAVLLLMSWAEQHGKDLLTAAQGVRVNEQGQLIVMAEMRVELANDRGYDMLDITPDDRRRTECTVEVRTPQGEKHQLTVRLEEVHESIRALQTRNGKPTPWATKPEDMLLRTAQRGADKRFCRSAAVVIDQEDWTEPEPADALDVLTAPAQVADEPVEVTESEGDPLTDPPPPKVTEAQLRKLGVAKVLRTATELGQSVALVEDVAKDQDLARRVVERLGS